MREIKFRVWIKKEKRMEKVVGLGQDGKQITVPDSDGDGTYNRHYGFDKFDLMQYTGLKDKNGKEIYEWDIVKCYSYFDEDDRSLDDFTIKMVYWGDEFDYPGFELKPADEYCDYNQLQHYASIQPGNEKIEVIGNIYETPELLINGKRD